MGWMNLSAIVHHSIPKPARTIVDLAGREVIQSVHLAETLQNHSRLMVGCDGDFCRVYIFSAQTLCSSAELRHRAGKYDSCLFRPAGSLGWGENCRP